jgi:hypothetical protein
MPPTHLIPDADVVVRSWKRVRKVYEEYVDVFEEAGLLMEFIRVLDYVDSTLAAVERYRPPPAIVRTLIHDGFNMLDDFAKEYRGYVGKVMDYVCMELRSLLYEVLGGE